MAWYMTKPCKIEAILWTGENQFRIYEFCGDAASFDDDGNLHIATLEGDMRARKWDYIIRGLNGEFYPCEPSAFHQKYELID